MEAESEQTAVEGELAVLLCNVSSYPSPRITWFRIESEIITLADQEVEDMDFGVYQVSEAVSLSDAGTYRCTGRYHFRRDTKDIELVVLSELRVEDVFCLSGNADTIAEAVFCWQCCQLIGVLCVCMPPVC